MEEIVNNRSSKSEKPPSAPAEQAGNALGLPELLAPAGNWECAKAAVENGADAIYFGLERFNARMRADNFTAADLPQLMDFLHRRGVKGYVTFNTLVFTEELAAAEDYLRTMIAAGVDAVIVQDIGLCRLIRRLSPDFPIHASTQMTITSAAGVAFAQELGCNLVVLARECSIRDMAAIHRETASPTEKNETQTPAVDLPAGNIQRSTFAFPPPPCVPLPLEVFVHGALCVAYSGQCLTSESLGGRSANRGECAQACRMPYDLIADGRPVPLGDRRYLLSPQDLAGLELLPELAHAGIASLKIEGRLKSPEYVANVTRVYRQALDALAENRPQDPSHSSYNLEMAFSRGLFTGWMQGTDNQKLVHARFGKKRGVYLGEITRVSRQRVALTLQGPLKPGDGVVFDAGQPDQSEEGGRVYGIRPLPSQDGGQRGEVELEFGHGDLNFSRIRPGNKLWKTSDPELDRQLRQTYAGETPHFRRPILIEVHGREGSALTIISRDEGGHVVQVPSTIPLARAEKTPLTSTRLEEQLGRLGGTPFRLSRLENHLQGEVILPVSELNRLRREMVGQLESLRARPLRWSLREEKAWHPAALVEDASPASSTAASELIVLVRNLAQLEEALHCGAATVYCELENPKHYRDAVACFRQFPRASASEAAPLPSFSSRPSIWVAPPRIFKAGEDWILKQVRSCEADGYLVRNYDHLRYFADQRCIGDFSLNVANPLTAEYFLRRYGLERLTASYDLNMTQLTALLRSAPPSWFEITIHQHMPMFHMEHCVFCAFLSQGSDYTNCGRPCDKHQVRLRDRVGAEHVLKADAGCRNTVFNARAQTGAEYVAQMQELGARHFRIEFVDETPEQVRQTISRYRDLLLGRTSGAELWRALKLWHQLGVTRGPMDRAETR